MTIISDKLMCRCDGLMSGVSTERFAEPAGELKEVREPKLISKTHRHLTFSNEPNQTLDESVKTPKPLKTERSSIQSSLVSLIPAPFTNCAAGSDFCSVCARDLSVAAAVFHAG